MNGRGRGSSAGRGAGGRGPAKSGANKVNPKPADPAKGKPKQAYDFDTLVGQKKASESLTDQILGGIPVNRLSNSLLRYNILYL